MKNSRSYLNFSAYLRDNNSTIIEGCFFVGKIGFFFISLLFLGFHIAPFLISASYFSASSKLTDEPQDIQKSIEYLERARYWTPEDPQIVYALAMAHKQLDQPEQVITLLEEAYRLQPDNLLIQNELALSYSDLNSFDSVREIWLSKGLAVDKFLQLSQMAWLQGQYDEMSTWYEYAIRMMEEPFDVFDTTLLTDALILESFVSLSNWSLCSWCLVSDSAHWQTQQGVLELSFSNIPQERDAAAIVMRPRLPLKHTQQLTFKLRGNVGAQVNIEVVVDGQRTRIANYRQIPEDWTIWEFPISGERLDELVVAIVEEESVTIPKNGLLLVDWIALQ